MGAKPLDVLLKEAKGISVHGNSLRISFQYKGDRLRETLSLPLTKPNLNYAKNMRSAILHDIKTKVFDYCKYFPESKNAAKYGDKKVNKNEVLHKLAKKYLKLKVNDIGIQSVRYYETSMSQCIEALGSDLLVSELLLEDVMKMKSNLIKSRKASTVNSYLVVFKPFLEFAYDNGYLEQPLHKSLKPFKTATEDPDPLEMEEYETLIKKGCVAQVDKNIVTLAIYTGLRTGELCSLAWEDIDLANKCIYVNRTITEDRRFKLPKTYEQRTVYLLPPAIDALKSQKFFTFMMPSEEIQVHQVDKTQVKNEKLRPVFRPGMSQAHGRQDCEPWYKTQTFHGKWGGLLKRADIRYRVPYQTRHTYACWTLTAHGNVAFIAKQMGHKDLSMVIKIYGRWMDSSSQNESDFIWSEMMKKGHNRKHEMSQE